jgi:hypothetical protein
MKLSKKFITAIAMLTLSVVMLTTSSFAWFSMNTEVTATDMTVTAKADQVFLQISNGAKVYDSNGDLVAEDDSNSMFSDKSSMITVEATEKSAKLYPTAVVESFDSANGTIVAFGAGSQKKGTSAWVKNYSKDVEQSAAAGKYSAIGTVTDFYLLNTFYLRLNPSAGNEEALAPLNSSVSLAIQKTESDPDDEIAKSVSILVVCGEYAQLWKQDDSGKFANAGDATLTGDAKFNSEAGPVEVKVYVFFDGENENCTTANFSAIKATGYKVQVNFNVTPVA